MAKKVLMLLSAIQPSDNCGATRISELVAQFLSTARDGTYTVTLEPSSSRGVVYDPGGRDVLTVVQVDYHTRLYNAEPDGPRIDRQTLFTALGYALIGLWRLTGSIISRNRAQSGRARLQLALGFAAIVVLFGSFAAILLAVLAALQPDLLPDAWESAPATPYVIGASAATLVVASFWWIRPKLLVGGRILRAAMRYTEHESQMLAVADAFDRALDDILDNDPDAEVHVLAYSFGSLVAIDAIFPRDSSADVERRSLDRIKSLVTIGAPVDYIRLFYPEHFLDRFARIGGATDWINIYIPADVLGSDFVEQKPKALSPTRGARKLCNAVQPKSATDVDPQTAKQFRIGDRTPTCIAEGRPRITGRHFATMDGFQVHGGYWAPGEPRYLRRAIPMWVPQPATAVATHSIKSANGVDIRSDLSRMVSV